MATVKPQAPVYFCQSCSASFEAARDYRAHVGKFHPPPTAPKTLVVGTVCLVCCAQFHTPGRLHKHLNRARLRLRTWIASGRRADPEEIRINLTAIKEQSASNRRTGHQDHLAQVPPHK
eukprot:1367416-Pyramimonas_sp.AAC.1